MRKKTRTQMRVRKSSLFGKYYVQWRPLESDAPLYEEGWKDVHRFWSSGDATIKVPIEWDLEAPAQEFAKKIIHEGDLMSLNICIED